MAERPGEMREKPLTRAAELLELRPPADELARAARLRAATAPPAPPGADGSSPAGEPALLEEALRLALAHLEAAR